MADIITELASKCGISPDMAKKGLGTLLAAFKHALPAESFAKIEAAIPGAASMLTDAEAQGEASSGGVLGTIKDMAGLPTRAGEPRCWCARNTSRRSIAFKLTIYRQGRPCNVNEHDRSL